MRLGLKGYSNGVGDWEIIEFEVTVKAVRQAHELMVPERIVEALAHQSK
jgi:hypothetical protein